MTNPLGSSVKSFLSSGQPPNRLRFKFNPQLVEFEPGEGGTLGGSFNSTTNSGYVKGVKCWAILI